MAEELQFTAEQLIEVIRQRYPELLPILEKPGVWDVVMQALRDAPEAWPKDRLARALQTTPYYQNTPVEVRQWDALMFTDPATARERGIQAGNMVNDLAQNLGIQLSGVEAWDLATAAAAGGWDANRLRYEMLSTARTPGGINFTNEPTGGELAANAAQVKSVADSYGVPLTDDIALAYGRDITRGIRTMDSITGEMQTWAAAMFPALADQIRAGVSVQQFAQPYLNLAVNELGIAPTSISVRDPKWTNLFLYQDDKGQRLKSMNEVLSTIRSDPVYGFDTSLNATQTASQLATQLLQRFGAAA